MNEQGFIQDANITLEKMLGLGRSEMLNKSLTSFILKDDQDIYYLHSRKLLEQHEQQTCELRMSRKDDDPLWVRLDTNLLNVDVWG